MKLLFDDPEIVVIPFEVVGIITTSNTTNETLDEDELPDFPIIG